MSEIVIRIEGLDRLTEALQALQTLRDPAGSQTGKKAPQNPPQPAPVPQATSNIPTPAPAAPVQGAPLQQPIMPTPLQGMPSQPPVTPAPVPQIPQAAPSVPAPAPAVPVQPAAAQQPGQPPVQPVPTTAAPQQYSFDQLAVALSNVCMRPDGQPKVQALLQQFGVNALFDLPKDRYGEFATALRGIGGVI